MSVTKITLGKHENIPIAEFGSGDIKITKATMHGEMHQSCLMFYNQEPREIGSEDNDYEGLDTDQLPEPKMILRFSRPESITALIHSLVELQKKVFKSV